jgi:hypothetical protein
VDDAIVHVLTKVFGRSVDEIRSDTRRYVAYQQDDSTFDEDPSWIDWDRLEVWADDDDDDDDADDDDDDDDDDED